jgi:hypothetical protein
LGWGLAGGISWPRRAAPEMSSRTAGANVENPSLFAKNPASWYRAIILRPAETDKLSSEIFDLYLPHFQLHTKFSLRFPPNPMLLSSRRNYMTQVEPGKTNRENGKQESALTGFKHGLTGQCLILQPHEVEPCRRMTEALRSDYKPGTEIESQLVQHIVDCNMRLHRIAAIENNMFSVGAVENTREDVEHDDATEAVIARTRTWIRQADSFEKLGRHESRISRQMLQYTRELDRIQSLRKSQIEIAVEAAETEIVNTELALFCNNGQALSPQASGQGRDAVVRASLCKKPSAVWAPDASPRTINAVFSESQVGAVKTHPKSEAA